MRDQDQGIEELVPPSVPRAMPNAQFAHKLGQEIRDAAYRRFGGTPAVPLHEMVISLRKLVLLLSQTLVPIHPRQGFVHALGQELDAAAAEWLVVRQERVRWLMVGGVVGSALSLLGVVAAFLLRRRARPQTKTS